MRFAILRELFAGHLPALVIFDLDGTLIDSVPDIARALDATFVAHGLEPPGEARVRAWVGRGSAGLVRDALAFAATPVADEALRAVVLEQYLARYLADCVRDTRVLPGAAELLRALRAAGVRLACVTNKPGAIARRVLDGLGLIDCFDTLLGGDSGAGVKPAPGPLLRAMAEAGVTPGATLMVGDSRHDVDAARAAGIAVVCRADGYNHGEDIRNSAPDRVVAELGALL